VAHDRVFGFGTNARKIASGRNRGYIGLQPNGKTEIPGNSMRIVFLRRTSRFYGVRAHRLIQKTCQHGHQVVGIVVERVTALHQLRDFMKKFGFRRLIRRIAFRFGGKLAAQAHLSTGERASKDAPVRRKFPVYFVASHDSAECTDLLRSLEPDLFILLDCGIIRQSILAIPRLGTLNAHYGKLPKYRGVSVTSWALLDGDRPAVSVYFVDEGIDTGPILAVREVPLKPKFEIADVREESGAVAADLLIETIDALERGTAHAITQAPTEGLQYFEIHPRLRALAEIRLRRLVCQS